MASTTPARLLEEELDDLLYFARVGEQGEFNQLTGAVCERANIKVAELLEIAKDEDSGNGLMHMAAANGHEALLQDMCKALSNPSPQNPAMLAVLNSQNKAGNTALHWAALNGHLPSVKVLLENGADPTITNHRGHDAIYEAELNDKTDVVKWVLEEGGAGLEAGFGDKAGESEGEVDDDEEAATEDDGNILSKVVEKVKEIDIKEGAAQA